MIDRRELILSNLFTVLQTVAGIANYYRNRGELGDDLRPALILFDGDEIADDRSKGRGRLAAVPNLVSMTVGIHVVLKDRKPANANVGQDLNAFRMAILKVIMGSAALRNACGPNGDIQYEGAVTDLASGRDMTGEIALSVTFVYPLLKDDVTL